MTPIHTISDCWETVTVKELMTFLSKLIFLKVCTFLLSAIIFPTFWERDNKSFLLNLLYRPNNDSNTLDWTVVFNFCFVMFTSRYVLAICRSGTEAVTGTDIFSCQHAQTLDFKFPVKLPGFNTKNPLIGKALTNYSRWWPDSPRYSFLKYWEYWAF